MKRIKETQKSVQRLQKTSSLIIVVILVLFGSYTSNAQKLEAGVFLGASYYLGDLNPQIHFDESNLAYGGVLKFNINPRLSLGFTATQANISSDATEYNINHKANEIPDLSTQILEFALVGEINFFPYVVGARNNNNWTPYLFGGAATFKFRNSNSMSIPFGLGIKMSPAGRRIGINLFWSARRTFTDDIDDITTIDYVGYNRDWYLFYGLNITYAFSLGKDNDCRNLIYR